MTMRRTHFSVPVLSLLTGLTVQGQSIVAGVHTTGDVYVDIPNVWMPYIWDLGFWNNFHVLDMDLDGTLDLSFHSISYHGGAGQFYQFTVEPLAPHVTIAIYTDTFPACCPYEPSVLAQVPDTLPFGTLIDAGLDYEDSVSYIKTVIQGGWYAPMIDDWDNVGERYLGVRLSYPWDTLYGWVRMSYVEIMDHACNINSHVGIGPVEGGSAVAVYPNPFTDRLTMATRDPEAMELILFDLAARPVLRSLIAGTTTIATTHLAEGMYVYELKKNGTLMKQGRIVKN